MRRKQSEQGCIYFPAVPAQATEFERGETFERIIEDKANLLLRKVPARRREAAKTRRKGPFHGFRVSRRDVKSCYAESKRHFPRRKKRREKSRSLIVLVREGPTSLCPRTYLRSRPHFGGKLSGRFRARNHWQAALCRFSTISRPVCRIPAF
jgi:hypothetical protein